MRVFLRVSRKGHPLYEELFNNPPRGIDYIKSQKVVHHKSKENKLREIKMSLWRAFIQRFPSAYPISTDAKLIHSTNNLLPITRTPWVIDTESQYGFFGFNYNNYRRNYYRHLLKRVFKQKSFRKILAWSEICKRELVNTLGEEFRDRIEVVYPAHQKVNGLKNSKKPRKLLFVSRRFEHKGGYELLDAFERINPKFKCELTMVSDFPKEIWDKYKDHKKINLIRANLSRSEVLKYFREADLFVYPTRIDTFGFVLVEALAHGLPIVSTKHYAIPEIVEDSGILVDPLIKWEKRVKRSNWVNDYDYLEECQKKYLGEGERIVEDIKKSIESILENPKEYKSMRKKAIYKVSKGKFSIESRNKKLKKVYEDSLE